MYTTPHKGILAHVQPVWLQSIQFSLPEHFPSVEEFLFTFYKDVTSFNLFNDCNYQVIVEVVCSSVMQKVFL